MNVQELYDSFNINHYPTDMVSNICLYFLNTLQEKWLIDCYFFPLSDSDGICKSLFLPCTPSDLKEMKPPGVDS